MQEDGRWPATVRILITMAAVVVIVAGLRAARDVAVPFLFAVFIAILCLPMLNWLRRKGLPNFAAVALIAGAFIIFGSVLAVFVGMSVTGFVQALPQYQSHMDAQTTALFDWLKRSNIEVSAQGLLRYLAPSSAMSLTETVVSSAGALAGNGLLIFLTVGFVLIEASSFPAKLRASVRDPEKTLAAFRKFGQTAQRYLIIKTITSTATGVAIWLCLVIIGVDYPVLWGLLAFLLNFVPYIGGTLATVPPVLLALVQLGVGPAVWTLLGCVVVNTSIAVVEPMLLSGGIGGLSALVVFLSLVFWSWVLGPIGAVLSVPLTIVVKIALESHEESRWAAVLLGPPPSEAGHPRTHASSETDQ